MTLENLFLILSQAMPYKVAYHSFPVGNAPDLPFVCIVTNRTDNFGADNHVYHHRTMVDVELYTKAKDPTTEALIEGAFDSAGIFYNATDTYLDDERCYERIYEIEV